MNGSLSPEPATPIVAIEPLPRGSVGACFDRERLIDLLSARFRLQLDGIHGRPHWLRVEAIGHWLGRHLGADLDLITLFALLHDCERVGEDHDPGHGHRAAKLAQRVRGDWFDCDDARFSLLAVACRGHSQGRSHANLTVQVCWDADRLDLWRLDIEPDPARLSTPLARTLAVIDQVKGYEAVNGAGST